MDPLSVTAATLAIIQASHATYKTIQHLKGLPKAFEEVGQNLPLAEDTLVLVKKQLESTPPTESTTKAIETVLKDCQERAKSLKTIFQEIKNVKTKEKDTKEWSAVVSFYRTMVLHLGKAHRVEALMQDILNGLKGLTMNQVFRTASQRQMEKLENAIKKLSEVEPSIEESDFDQRGTSLHMNIANGGKGYQMQSGGYSTQKNYLGPQFTSKGPMNFGMPMEQWMKD